MAKLKILEFPDPRLRTVAEPVTEVNDEIRTIIDDMFETMYDAPGIGLAATQVDIHLRIVTMDLSEEQDDPLVMINPEFEVLDEEPHKYQEGCLSVPGYYEDVVRPQSIRVTALNRDGEEYSFEANDLLAVCVQHELDHLNGKLFVDHISTLKRNRIRGKLEKKHRQEAHA
ncbi:peptide deformylase [Pontibacterium sp. N1Y112]|uniref:Peptide deformylase n=1 Tax=Pontibacterium sinense TaxID=2781979 RepID=A0A8J7FC95_9GAMM|nr:peptide deformylase [Pontibacterium sinense]MBE9398890.1 peptide deformylase [Pontibacterium sinense]